MKNLHAQQGIGLIEILVATLILAVAVLGFIALQYRSLEAANEAYYRTQAINVARDLAERMRANQFARTYYIQQLTYQEASTNTDPKAPTAPLGCLNSSPCDQKAFAEFDAAEIKFKAAQAAMQVAMQTCSGVSRQCIYIAWDDTLPKDGDEEHACTKDGVYVDGSRCVVMEAYE